jgi:hypothetical protein
MTTITINGQKTKVNFGYKEVTKVIKDNVVTWGLTVTVDGIEYKNLYEAVVVWSKKTGVPSRCFQCVNTGERFGNNQKKMIEHLLN